MRLAQVVIPDEKREDIISALGRRELGVSTTRETSDESVRVRVQYQDYERSNVSRAASGRRQPNTVLGVEP